MARVGALTATVRRRNLAVSLITAVACLAAASAHAQVLEIGDEGAIVVYDRPAVFDGDQVRTIAPAARPIRPLRSAAATSELASVFRQAASAVDLSPELLSAVARQESRFNPSAVSRAGAVGVMQLMPGTARDLHCDPFNPTQNIHGGARYLRAMMDAFKGDLPLALAAYNAGPAAVKRFGGVPPFAETRAYVDAVLHNLSTLAVRSTQDGASHDSSPLRF